MKKTILSAAFGLFALAASAQVVNGTATMGPQYANQVYYKLSNQDHITFPANSWDIAFYRQNPMAVGIRTNDNKGIQVFEASADIAEWSSISVANEANWTRLYNGDTDWLDGSLMQGSATYGFGEYNPVTHIVSGTVVFVLKYSATNYKKLKIDTVYMGYNFTYSNWDSATSTWGADITVSVPNSDNTTQIFNYYNLETNAAVVAEPASTGWDLVWTKYQTTVPSQNGPTPYVPTGVLVHPNVEVAINDEPNGPVTNPELTYSANMNSIGWDWKALNASFQYDVLTNRAHYIKVSPTEIYRLVFATFSGGSAGETTFNYENVTSQLSTIENTQVSFGVFPNPSTDKRINLVFESGITSENNVNIYNLNGAKVFSSKLASTGFNNSTLDLTTLSAGIYVLEFVAGDYKAVKKIVLQ